MILIAGDSLTAGTAGIGYSRYLTQTVYTTYSVSAASGADRRHQQFMLRGVDGDTMSGITKRVLMYLRGRNSRNISGIIIEAGHNDLLIPHMAGISENWKSAMTFMMENAEKQPIPDPDAFIEAYRNALTKIREKADKQGIPRNHIAVTDLMPLGEDLSSPLNRTRSLLCRSIRKLADELGIRSISLAEPAEHALSDRPVEKRQHAAYLIPNPQSITDDARFIHRHPDEDAEKKPEIYPATKKRLAEEEAEEEAAELEQRAAVLSRQRGLLLTVDGVHPNAAGARLIAEAVRNYAEQIFSESSHDASAR